MKIDDDEKKMIYPEYPWDTVKYIEKVERIFNKLLKNVNNQLESKGSKRLNVKFRVDYDENEINAKADENGEPFIEIEFTFFRALEKLTKTIFSEDNEKFYKTVSYESEYDNNKVQIYINLLVELSFSVIILHELGHIFNGHLLCKKDRSRDKYAVLEEFESSKDIDDSIDIMLLQAMENDADNFSSAYMISIYCHKYALDRIDLDEKYIKSQQHMLFLIDVASIIIYSLLGMGKNKCKMNFKQMSHLPARYRILNIITENLNNYKMNNVGNNSIDFSENEYIEFNNAIELWVDLYMRDCIKVNKSKWNITNNSEELDEEHKKYYEKVEKYLHEELSGILNKYERFGSAQHIDNILEFEDILRQCADEVIKY